MTPFRTLLNQAIGRRAKMSKITNALRLVNGRGDALDGLLIDRYNKHIHIQVLKDHWHKQMDEICHRLESSLPVEYMVVKYRNGPLPLEVRVKKKDKDHRTIVEEYDLKFEVDLNDGLNCGLFLDMRHNRWVVGQCSNGKKVLNCFSYTCSFGVHARAAGAREVINTDISRKILERGRNNYQLNDLSTSQEEFVKADSMAFLQRAVKKENSFDVIILDPPSFARHEGQVFQVKRDLPKLISLAVTVLNPGGALLVASNYSEISYTDLEGMLARNLNGRRVGHIQRVGQDQDFYGSNSFKESFLVGLWVKLL